MADKEIGNSRLIKTWASTGERVVPDDNEISEGWLFEQRPPHEVENDRQNQLGKKINHVLKNGVPEWDSLNEYGLYDIVKHDNDIYYATGPSTNQEPPNGNWALLSAQFFSNDATHLSSSANKSSPSDADKMWLVENSSTENRHITASELNSNFYGRDASNIRNSTNKPTPDDTDAFRIVTSANANRRLTAVDLKSWIEKDLGFAVDFRTNTATTGNHTEEVPSGATHAYIVLVAGGGGGGSGVDEFGNPIGGGGGGAGGVGYLYLDLDGITSLGFFIGSGGGQNGGGQDSVLTNQSGGEIMRSHGGGTARTFSVEGVTLRTRGGIGGGSTGASIEAVGGCGTNGIACGGAGAADAQIIGGNGGNSAYGGGGNGAYDFAGNVNFDAISGQLFGGGGGGGIPGRSAGNGGRGMYSVMFLKDNNF